MKQDPLVSIIISSYNYGRFLNEAIDSALNQTYANIELIVVDDGSSDDSRAIIASYGDRIIRVLKENGGQASALNAGFNQSRGEIICFLDSDDALIPTVIEKASRLLLDTSVMKVHWPLFALSGRSKKMGYFIPAIKLPQGNLKEAILCGGPRGYVWPPTSGNAWGRRFLESVLPIPEAEYVTCPDLYLCSLAPLFGLVKTIAEPQGYWRIHGANHTWQKAFEERLEADIRRWEHCFKVLHMHCRSMGFNVDIQDWRDRSWYHQLRDAISEIKSIVPEGSSFILADDEQWATGSDPFGRRRIPFLEHDGQYWGPPPDDQVAIKEVERLRSVGASFIVFAWPAFWWLDHYRLLLSYLRSCFSCVLDNERLVVFDLRKGGEDDER